MTPVLGDLGPGRLRDRDPILFWRDLEGGNKGWGSGRALRDPWVLMLSGMRKL